MDGLAIISPRPSNWYVNPFGIPGSLLILIDYLANCGGDCTTVDKTTLEWFKIDAQGLYDDTTVPGTWASDTLIANNNSWTVTIPSDIASGNYVLRHEIIALHSAGEADGAQNYPQWYVKIWDLLEKPSSEDIIFEPAQNFRL